nr:hypothetical protein [Tanacetum cinerariifolium]
MNDYVHYQQELHTCQQELYLTNSRADQQNASHESGFMHEEEDAHVTLTTIYDKTEGPLQSSSVSSDFTSKLLNLDDPSPDINSLMDTSTFDQRVFALETKVSEFNQTSQFVEAVSLFPNIVNNYLASKLKKQVNVVVQLQSNKLREKAQAENHEFLNQVDLTIKEIIKGQVKAQVSTIMPRIEKYITESLGVEVLKSSKDAEPLKRSKSKESRTAGSSKGIKTQHQSFGKSTQAEEPVFEAANTKMQYDQGNKIGHPDDQPDNEEAPKHDWFQKPDKPQTPDRAGNKSKSVDFRSPQKWISTIAKARKPPRTFDELMGTPIDFSAYVMNYLNIYNLTREILVGLTFNLLKGTCKIFAELKYHFEECYKAVNDRLDWHNPKGREYQFDLSKPLPLIEDQGRQVVPTNYFINNDLEYLKGGSLSSKYATSTTRTKAANVKVMRWYDYGYLEEIVVRRDYNVLYKFKEGDFPRVNLYDIEDMLLFLVQKKLSNLDVDDRYDLGVALRLFTRRIVILHRNQRDLPRDIPLDSVEVLKYDKRSKNQWDLPRDIPLDSVEVLRHSLLLTLLCCDDTHDVTPRVSALAGCDMEGEDFTDVPDDEATLTFLHDLGYKIPLNMHTNMFIDHMHQSWRTLDAIINKCLSGNTASNDKL